MNEDQVIEFSGILGLIQDAQTKVRSYTNTTLVILYYQVGKTVSEKLAQGVWGQKTVQSLADHIQQEQPQMKSFNRRGLYRMKQFYETYAPGSEANDLIKALLLTDQPTEAKTTLQLSQLGNEFIKTATEIIRKTPKAIVSAPTQFKDETHVINSEIVSAPTQISWSLHLEILASCRTAQEKLFYLIMAAKEKWSLRDIRRQIESGYFERYLISHQKPSPVPQPPVPNSNEHLKDIYTLEFLGLHDDFSEENFQKAIIKNLRKFILEVGSNFSFVGEEYRIQVGNKDFEVDLLFYNRSLQCLVAFDLKITDFKPEYLGKMNFYLEALDRHHKQPHENPSVGVILCKSKHDEIVEIAMSRSLSPTKVAEYTTELIDKKLLQAKLHELGELYEQSKEL